jgi:hypothetical protein
MTINNSVLTSYGYSNISTMGDTVTTVTSSPSYFSSAGYAGQVYTIDSSLHSDPTKRYSLKNEGKLPYDVWALMFNDNILND